MLLTLDILKTSFRLFSLNRNIANGNRENKPNINLKVENKNYEKNENFKRKNRLWC